MATPKYDNNGRPPKYKTPEDMQKAIDEYFDRCDNRIKEIHTKEGESYGISDPEPYAMAGLAYALGMDRRSLLDYKHKDGFLPLLTKARNKVEADVERRMLHRDTFTPGLIFNAKNNFDWKDKTETDITSKGEAITKVDNKIITEWQNFIEQKTIASPEP